MNPDKFPSNNLEYKEVKDLPQEHHDEFKDVEGGFVRKSANENREEVFDFVDKQISQEVVGIIEERGLGDLTIEDYSKVRKEAIERVIERMKDESPELYSIINETEKQVDDEISKLTSVLEKNDASSEEINDSRRSFLKMFGLGVVIASGMALSNKAEAVMIPSHESKTAKAIHAIDRNNAYISTLLSLTNDDIKSINEGRGYQSRSAGSSVSKSFEHRKEDVIPAATLGFVGGGLISALMAGIMIGGDRKAIKEISKISSVTATATATLGALSVLMPTGGRLDDFVAGHNGSVSRDIILEEVKRVQAENTELLKVIKISSIK